MFRTCPLRIRSSAIVCAICLLLQAWAVDLRTVNTSWGILKGEVVSPGVEDLPPVAQYLGVPYGVAPSGQYRFNMAISAAKWTHMPKEARTLSPVCVQTGLPDLSETRAFKFSSAQRFDYVHKLLPKLKKQSEDCLYMNLYVPERIEVSLRESHLPVLVLVHGDEYGWNAGNPYNGTMLAAHAQVIVVTLNYRLGAFGFLGRCESSSCAGNSGISDLVSALKMLSGVLPSFGGDPKLVTLMGWGSGGSLVSLLMASPLTQPSRRLFKRAILLDGSALAPWAITNNPQPFFMQLVEQLGCAPNNRSMDFNGGIERMVRCMQDHSADNVTRAAHKVDVPTFLSAFAPIVDGQLIPNKPSISFGSEYGSLFREIDLLVGTVSNPAHHFLSNEDLKHGTDLERREKIFRTLVRNLYDYHRNEIYSAIVNEYTDWENPRDHPKSLRNGVLNALSDVLFVAPLIETLRLHSNDEHRKQANTFMFVFAHETRSWMQEQPNSGIRGSLSGDHIPYILGYPLFRGDKDEKLYSGFSADDKGLSRVMMHYVGNFVKSGDPSKPGGMPKATAIEERFHSIAWPAFDQPNRESYLEITDRPRVKNYYRNAEVGFWNSLIPALHKSGKDDDVPEEHHFLHRHFVKESFFGKVRPYASFANEPFPPPPLPPTPPPKDVKRTTSAPIVETTPGNAGEGTTQAAQYSTMLSVTVVVGCSLLFLNICVFFGLYRQCDKNKKSKKKLQLQYQTYASNSGAAGDLTYNVNSPLGVMPPPPPPIAHSSVTNSTINHSVLQDDPFDRTFYATYNGNASGGCVSLQHRHSFHEQEPLLSASHKNSQVLRPGVSPTCPRHGRAAIAMASSRGNSLASGGNNQPPALEEIQV